MSEKYITIVLLLFLSMLYGSSCITDEERELEENSGFTKVKGSILEDTTWDLLNSPYIVEEDVVVERGVTLTIEPQVEIRFERDKGLIVKGVLTADGSVGFTPSDESELFKFTSNQSMPDMGDWKGIKFDNTNDDKSVVSYSKIQYAKIGIDCFSSSPRISDNFIEFNEIGIKLSGSLFSNITHNTIRSNINGLIIYPRPPHISLNTISQNEIGIVIYSWGKARYNNFIDNTGYSILTKYARPFSNYNATSNWWNTTKIEEIEKQIYHKNDNNNLSNVFYIPYSTNSISDTYPRFKEN